MILLIWYDVWMQINIVSKMIKRKDMQFDIALKFIESTVDFLTSYKQAGFKSALDAAKDLTIELEMDENKMHFSTT